MRKLLIPIIILFLLAFSVSASIWRGEANAGLDDTTCNYCGYSLNYPSPLQNVTNASSYSKCLIGGSVFTPVAFDLDGDSYSEIITGTTTAVNVYNRDCGHIDTFNLVYALKGAPMITNSDGDAYLDLVIGSSKGVSVYEWSPVANEFILQHFIGNYTGTLGAFACPYLSNKCIGFQSGGGGSGTAVFNMVNLSVYAGTTGLTKVANDNYRPGISSLRISLPGSYLYRAPYCFLGASDYDLKCGIWDETGALLGSYTLATLPLALSSNEIDSFYAKLGGATYLFTYYKASYTGGSPNLYDEGVLISETTTYAVQYTDSERHILNATYGNFYSNWAVGDFNKDGQNEACYLYGAEYDVSGSYANTYNKTFLKCLDSGLGVILDEDVTGIMDINKLAMGDFYPSGDYLGFSTIAGLFYYDGGNVNMLFNSSYTTKSTGYPIVFMDGTAGAPMVVFTDDTTGFIIKSVELAVSCGNGVCDLYENPFNCLEDCAINVTAPTENETYAPGTAPAGTWAGFNVSICASGYVEYGKCSLKPGGRTCALNSECLSGECANGKCNSPGAWDSIDNFATQTFGADTTSKMFISLVIIIGLALAIIFATGGHIAGVIGGIGSMFITTIFFLIVGWLPAFFVIGLVLIVILIVALLLVLR